MKIIDHEEIPRIAIVPFRACQTITIEINQIVSCFTLDNTFDAYVIIFTIEETLKIRNIINQLQSMAATL